MKLLGYVLIAPLSAFFIGTFCYCIWWFIRGLATGDKAAKETAALLVAISICASFVIGLYLLESAQ